MVEQFTLTRLRNEILLDPASLGYAAFYTLSCGSHITVTAFDPTGLASNLNTPGFPVSNVSATPSDILSAIDAGEFANLSQAALDKLKIVLSVPEIDMSNKNTNGLAQSIFPEFGLSRRNLAALEFTIGPRSKSLWGLEVSASVILVNSALNDTMI